jgi:hypothetical protein
MIVQLQAHVVFTSFNCWKNKLYISLAEKKEWKKEHKKAKA